MSDKSTVNERPYCSYCGAWLEPGDEHNWQEHPATIHGDIERAREKRYGETNE